MSLLYENNYSRHKAFVSYHHANDQAYDGVTSSYLANLSL